MPTTARREEQRRHAAREHVEALEVVLREEFGVPFRFYAAEGGEPVGPPGTDDTLMPRPEVERVAREDRAEVFPLAGGRLELQLPIADAEGPALVAVGVVPALCREDPERAQEQDRLRRWLRSAQGRLRASLSKGGRDARRPDPAEAGRAWDALHGLDHLLSHLRIHREPTRNRRGILRAAAELLGAGAVVWVPTRCPGDVIVEGTATLSPWDFGQLAEMLTAYTDWQGAGFTICNDVADQSWSVRFPQIRSLLGRPILDRAPIGWVLALNKGESAGAPAAFRKSDAALLAPLAALLGLNVRSYQRYQSLKDLLVGLTRSLTSAIDAKDTYTYGHSERVARIAVALGRELGLQDEELSDIYLAGLLHDIGKIGVPDHILGKRDPLTDEEFALVKKHVTIGYRILAGLEPIRHLLPGVLYHHERIDGKGYPEGLRGEAIPFLARILAVADSFDAMSTSRPYRSALPPASVEERLVGGAGAQWDRAVIEAFLRCKGKVHAIRQRGVGESLRGALEDAMRHQDSAAAPAFGLAAVGAP